MVCLFQVKIVSMNENAVLRSALDKNLKSAVTTACLMLPESFSEEDLFIEIAGLSYSGLYSVCPDLSPGRLLESLRYQLHPQTAVNIFGVWPKHMYFQPICG